ncbi:MAG: hypothetical protein HC824_07725, partial [Synechococcales cyanobacterium RM1_1_8]|nr:hypothetical protein [Synechococcales cyanobacterium RM1_1_8]
DNLKANHGLTAADLQGFEKKGDDVLVTFKVPPDTDKAAIEHSFDEIYYARLEAAEAKAQLDAEKRRGDSLEKMAFALANRPPDHRPINIQAVGQGNPMQSNSDSSRKITIGEIGGDFNASGQALNLGDISGQVTNAINQLPETADSSQPNLKDLLTQLQTALEADPSLSRDDKTEALSQIQTLAQAGQAPAQPEQKNLAKRALQMLTGILASTTATLTGTTSLLTAWQTLQPLIKGVFGL